MKKASKIFSSVLALNLVFLSTDINAQNMGINFALFV